MHRAKSENPLGFSVLLAVLVMLVGASANAESYRLGYGGRLVQPNGAPAGCHASGEFLFDRCVCCACADDRQNH
jgi:hypothetical protein